MIPVTTLNFTIFTNETFDFGRAPGSSLRGALYAALTSMYDTQQQNESRDDLDSNPVGWLLRLEDGQVSGGHDVARPIAIRPPLSTDDSEITFGLSFYGKAHETIPMVVSAIPLMGKLGVGRRRTPFELRHIDYIDPITGQYSRVMDCKNRANFELPTAPNAEVYKRIATMMDSQKLSVNFLTPTRIVSKKTLVHKPIFHIWFQRLLERIHTLSVVYTDKAVWLPFQDLLDVAQTIEIIDDQTRWFESWSGSRRDGQVKPLGGFVGQVRYKGDFTAILPYILLGQALQVGKNTVKGCGWYAIQYHWQA